MVPTGRKIHCFQCSVRGRVETDCVLRSRNEWNRVLFFKKHREFGRHVQTPENFAALLAKFYKTNAT